MFDCLWCGADDLDDCTCYAYDGDGDDGYDEYPYDDFGLVIR